MPYLFVWLMIFSGASHPVVLSKQCYICLIVPIMNSTTVPGWGWIILTNVSCCSGDLFKTGHYFAIKMGDGVQKYTLLSNQAFIVRYCLKSVTFIYLKNNLTPYDRYMKCLCERELLFTSSSLHYSVPTIWPHYGWGIMKDNTWDGMKWHAKEK